MLFPTNIPFPTLSRPPIVEGLIDFRLRPEQQVTTDKLLELEGPLMETYPVKQDIRTVQAAFQIGVDAGPPTSSTQLIGYRYESQEQSFVLQARLDGFTLSRLTPYSNWDELLQEAKRLWTLYSAVVGPSTILRIDVRYINRLHLLGSLIDFDDYLAMGPRIPEGLPQSLAEFLTRNVVPFPEENATMILTQALESFDPGSTGISILLDIDVYQEGAYDSAGEEFWNVLATLRHLKNKAFFGSITEKTLQLLL